jgi:hypothetical protein
MFTNHHCKLWTIIIRTENGIEAENVEEGVSEEETRL